MKNSYAEQQAYRDAMYPTLMAAPIEQLLEVRRASDFEVRVTAEQALSVYHKLLVERSCVTIGPLTAHVFALPDVRGRFVGVHAIARLLSLRHMPSRPRRAPGPDRLLEVAEAEYRAFVAGQPTCVRIVDMAPDPTASTWCCRPITDECKRGQHRHAEHD